MRSRPGLPFLVAALLLGGCSPPVSHADQAPKPAACTDSLYVRLARQHPDSLSDRAWQRLQTLDGACERARTQPASDMGGMGMMGMGHGEGRAWTILAPLVVLSMALAMLVFRL